MALQLQGRMEKEFMGVSVIYYIQRTPRTHQGLVRLELVSPSEKIVCGVSYACYTFRLPRNCHYYLCAVVTVANKCGLRDQSPYIYLQQLHTPFTLGICWCGGKEEYSIQKSFLKMHRI